MKIKNFFKHLNLVNKHRFLVFKLALKAGIPYRGLVHDLSKYSPVEFIESVKYYNGELSPIKVSKEKNGYSKAWLHHKGRNKHHFEYWHDFNAPNKTPIIPYKYTVEMICDTLAASMIYKGKKWNPSCQIEYFEKRKDKEYINESIKKVLHEVYEEIAKNGVDKVIKRKNLKRIYRKYVNEENVKNII